MALPEQHLPQGDVESFSLGGAQRGERAPRTWRDAQAKDRGSSVSLSSGHCETDTVTNKTRTTLPLILTHNITETLREGFRR